MSRLSHAIFTLSLAATLSCVGRAPAQEARESAKEIPLYPGAAPGSEKWGWSERSTTNPRGPAVTDVVRPVLLHYPAEKGKAVGTAMIVAPGGGFHSLMMSYEGVDVARRLNIMGVDAFVLKYRLVHGGRGAPPAQDVIKLAADDGRQAVRLMRQRAGEFGVRADRIGMIGYSAGGMVTAEALFGPAETRPDFAALIYGVSQIKEVPSPAPPLFLAVAADDALAVGHTIELFTAYRKGKGQAELHVFQMGAHGFVKKGSGADHYLDRLEEWLGANKLLSGTAKPVAPQPSAGDVPSERLQRGHALVEREIAAKEYSGVVTLVARDGHIVHFEAQGLTDIDSGKPMARDAIFRLASMSKVVTAVAVLVLVDEGKVRLTDPVSRFLPEFKDLKVAVTEAGEPTATLVRADREITGHDLLTHTSGLGSGAASLVAMMKEPQKPGDDLATVVSRLTRAPLDFQPGTRWAYSGLAGFDTLGRIVEVASGKDLERFLTECIYKPLGMTSTTFAPSPAQRARMVTLYTHTGSGLVKAPDQNSLVNPACFHGAGGLVGTAEDYWRFAQMLANGGEFNGKRILSRRMVELLGSAQVPKGVAGLPPGLSFGLGVRVLTDRPATGTPLTTGSYGWSGAYGTHFWVDPAKKLVAAFMANETKAGGAGAVSARDFEKAVMQLLATPDYCPLHKELKFRFHPDLLPRLLRRSGFRTFCNGQ